MWITPAAASCGSHDLDQLPGMRSVRDAQRHAKRFFLLAVQDINGACVGHLCVACAREAMPHADWSAWLT